MGDQRDLCVDRDLVENWCRIFWRKQNIDLLIYTNEISIIIELLESFTLGSVKRKAGRYVISNICLNFKILLVK